MPVALALCIASVVARPLPAQSRLTPSPVLDATALTRAPALSGFIIVRHTQHRDTATSVIRNARLTVQVRPTPILAVKLQADFAAGGRVGADSAVNGFAVTDAFIQLSPRDTAPVARHYYPALLVGQFKTPFSLEYMTSVARLPTANRSLAVDRLAPRRDIGALGHLDIRHRVVFMTGVVSGEGANARTNPDGKQLALARAVVLPYDRLAIAGKVGAEGSDRRSGYDVRWTPGRALAEGEFVRRRVSSGTASVDASGGYAALGYHVRPWLQPVVKWEQFEQRLPTSFVSTRVTAGANITNARETLRAQLDVVRRHDGAAAPHVTELVAQAVVYF